MISKKALDVFARHQKNSRLREIPATLKKQVMGNSRNLKNQVMGKGARHHVFMVMGLACPAPVYKYTPYRAGMCGHAHPNMWGDKVRPHTG